MQKCAPDKCCHCDCNCAVCVKNRLVSFTRLINCQHRPLACGCCLELINCPFDVVNYFTALSIIAHLHEVTWARLSDCRQKAVLCSRTSVQLRLFAYVTLPCPVSHLMANFQAHTHTYYSARTCQSTESIDRSLFGLAHYEHVHAHSRPRKDNTIVCTVVSVCQWPF